MMLDIPLKVLIIDPSVKSSAVLAHALERAEFVLSVDATESLDNALEIIKKKDVNSIYIDPLSLGLDQASEFIFSVREQEPNIVFVLYMDFISLNSLGEDFYFGERHRFHHYFKLDKRTAKDAFDKEVENTIRDCQGDLSFSLTEEKMDNLQKELKDLQEEAEDETAVVPIKILQDIQEQLSEYRKELEVSSGTRAVEFLGTPAHHVKYDRCFVVMPYSEEWSKSVEDILRVTCEEVGLQFTIAKSMEGRFIPNDIWQGISGCGIVIADLTGGNPNVTYEIGLADVLGREVVLISQGSKMPFDFSGQRLIIYENTINGALQLRQELRDRLNKVRQKLKELYGDMGT